MTTKCVFLLKRECEGAEENKKKIKKVKRVVIESKLLLAIEEMKGLLQNLNVYSPESLIPARAISHLVEFLAFNRYSDSEFVKLTVQVLSKLAEDASGHAEMVVQKNKAVVQQGLVPLLVDILKKSGNQATRGEAMWGLGMVASNSVECKDLVLECGGVEAVVNYLLSSIEDLITLRKGSWVLANLCRGEPQLRQELWKLALGAVKHLLQLQLKDAETTRNACRALSYLSQRGSKEQIQAVVDTGACPRLLELVANPLFAIPVLRTIANIATVQVQPILDHGGLDAIKKMLGSKVLHTSIVKEAGHAVSTIYAYGNKDQFHAILNS